MVRHYFFFFLVSDCQWCLSCHLFQLKYDRWHFPPFCLVQLACRWRRRTGHHSSPSSTMTLPMRYQPMCRSCSILHLQAGLVCWHGPFCCICDLVVASHFLIYESTRYGVCERLLPVIGHFLI